MLQRRSVAWAHSVNETYIADLRKTPSSTSGDVYRGGVRVLSIVVLACLAGTALADPDPTPSPTPAPDATPAQPDATPAPAPFTVVPETNSKKKPPANADAGNQTTPWYSGPYATNRFTHLAVTGVLGLYILSGYIFPTTPTAKTCRWCNPPGFDESARNALVWGDRGRADTYSTIAAYVVSPIVALTLLIAADKNASATRLIDDVLPVMETLAIVQVATVFGKWAFARERPNAHFADAAHPLVVGADNDSSFWSGHSVVGFAITTAAGTMCHFRHYWTEPYVWAAGITLSLTVEYLRIAADKHYLSDVFVGGLIGIAAGALVPRLMSRDIKIVPISNGVSVVGMF